jgi:hypothetical protein
MPTAAQKEPKKKKKSSKTKESTDERVKDTHIGLEILFYFVSLSDGNE